MNTAAKAATQMSQSGTNLLRVVLSSYFIGVSLGLVHGANVTALAKVFMPDNYANFLTNTTVFVLAYLVLMGVWLRPAALLLAIALLSNSLFLLLNSTSPDVMSDFWRDAALIAGLMMTYLQTTMRDVRRRAVLRRLPKARKISPTEKVMPRRVASFRKDGEMTSRPISLLNAQAAKAEAEPVEPLKSAEVINIFAA